MKTPDTKTKAEIAERRKRVASLYLLRFDQAYIADTIGCSQPTVSRDIDFLTKQWRAEAKQDIDNILARELEELNQMELETAKSYVKSKSNEKPTDSMKWLEIRLNIKASRAKLLGLDKPTKIDIDSKQQIIVNLKMEDCGNV